MKTNKGISLIVLVITIIVMIILAGAIILSLNNAGIIGKASVAVELSNEATVKQLAETVWAEAYLAGKRTQVDFETEIINQMKDAGVDTNEYVITATASGVTVEKVEAEHLYYSTLELAIADVNSGTLGSHDDSTKQDAEAVVYTHNNNVYVSLLKNVRLEETVYIYKDLILNLDGHEIYASKLGLYIGTDGVSLIPANVTINGNAKGSKFIAESMVEEFITTCGPASGSTMNITGGTYIVDALDTAYGISFNPNSTGTITNCHIMIGKNSKNSAGIVNAGNEVVISNCKVESKYSVSSVRNLGIFNRGIATINNCDITVTQTAIENLEQGQLVINGGIYRGYSCCVYTSGRISLKNATLKSVALLEEYVYPLNDYYKFIGRGLVIGGTSNVEIYVNNCDIQSDENSIILGNLFSEKSNKLYISNSKINTDKSVLIEDASCKVYIGAGCNFTSANTSLPSSVETTNKTY